MPNLKKNIILTLFFSFLIYLILIFFSDYQKFLSSLTKVSKSNLILGFFISQFILVLKFFRWQILLKSKVKNISISDSVLIFGLGQIMSISPGKFGEIIKSYFLKTNHDIEYVNSIPIIFAERFSEFLTLIFLESIFLIYLWESIEINVLLIITNFLLIIFIFNKKIFRTFFDKLRKIKFLKINENKIDALVENQKMLINPKIYIISILAWITEIFCFYIILSNFISDIIVLKAASIYLMAIILGSVSMLPGGIGTTESSLTYLMIKNGINIGNSAAVTILIRIFTLWIPILIGFLSLFIYLQKNKKIIKTKIFTFL
ncbi:MAG: flippase-like domain-containing protein [Ignavibacteriae bacterium]|nr:flippase-like domain-containing protein [Ignavibacteriota bacterium]